MKLTAVFFSFLMLFSASGWQLNLHYCGDKIASVALKSGHDSCKMDDESACHKPEKKAKSCCEKETPKPEKKCCHDKLVKYQSTDDYQPQVKQQLVVKATELLFGFELFTETFEPETTFQKVFEDPPPKQTKQHKYIFSTQRTLFG